MNIEISRLICLCRLGYKYVEVTGDMEFILYYIGRIGQAFSENIIAVIESYFSFSYIFCSLNASTCSKEGEELRTRLVYVSLHTF